MRALRELNLRSGFVRWCNFMDAGCNLIHYREPYCLVIPPSLCPELFWPLLDRRWERGQSWQWILSFWKESSCGIPTQTMSLNRKWDYVYRSTGDTFEQSFFSDWVLTQEVENGFCRGRSFRDVSFVRPLRIGLTRYVCESLGVLIGFFGVREKEWRGLLCLFSLLFACNLYSSHLRERRKLLSLKPTGGS